ncbi:hypothetical protein HMPREF0380_01386 [Eubacterium infirmum F0142]|nr:hypothetical protein HMPREF0380_01386 [Eubacterium infirmum F0142]
MDYVTNLVNLSLFLNIKKEVSSICFYFLLVVLFNCYASTNWELSLSNYLAKLTLRMITFQTRSGIRFATPNALA